VQGRFGTAIVQVLKIEPEKVRPFEEVAGELRRELGAERAKADILKLYDKIEDARTDGKTLAEAAEALKLTPRIIEAIDRSGRSPAGMPVAVPDPQRLLPQAFAAEVGTENDPLQFEGGYVWYEVLGVTPSRDRPLEEVKEQVEARWREQEIASRLKAKATEILDKLKAGTTLAEVAAANQMNVQTAGGIKRADAPPPLSAATVDTIFRTRKDEFGMAEAAQAGEQIVFKVTGIVIPPLDVASEEAKRAQETLNRSVTEDIFSEYIAHLESELGVKINQSALNQVISGGAVTN
jgi:peptidyl-prolyl cis-trans isomerase D